VAKLGDAGTRLATVAMHSGLFYAMMKSDLLDSNDASRIEGRISGEEIEAFTFGGRPILVDDTMPVDVGAGTGAMSGADVYTAYLFGDAAVAYSEIVPKMALETDRESDKGIDILINRKHFLMHPQGLSWTGTAAGNAPTNGELATPGNWGKAYSDDRNIPIVQLNIAVA